MDDHNLTAEDREPFLRDTGSPLVQRQRTIFTGVIQPCFAEFLGTTLFVTVAVCSVASGGTDVLTVALGHGLTIAVLVACFGTLSGGHFNPAVTFGAWMAGAIGPFMALGYTLCQLCGGIAGAGLTRILLSYPAEGAGMGITAYVSINGGIHNPGIGVSLATAALAEIFLTFLLVNSVIMTAINSRTQSPLAPVAIGLSVAVDIIMGARMSGASMNPARSFGPAVVATDLIQGVWSYHWIYWVGPYVGSLMAGISYRLFLCDNSGLFFTRRFCCGGGGEAGY